MMSGDKRLAPMSNLRARSGNYQPTVSRSLYLYYNKLRALVEGLNNKIRVTRRRAHGLRGEEYLRSKVLTCMVA
jgi:transposase